MSKKARRAGRQRARGITQAARHRQLGQTRGRRRKVDRPVEKPQPKTQRGPDRQVLSQSAEQQRTEPSIQELVDAVAARAKRGETRIPALAEQLGVSEERVTAAVRRLAERNGA